MIDGADIDSDYLSGSIENNMIIIMQHSTDGSDIIAKPGFVRSMRKSIYHSKEAGYIWGNVSHIKFIQWGFKQLQQDKSLYFHQRGNTFITLILVVYDMDLEYNNSDLLECFKSLLSETFKLKWIGQLQIFIVWEFTYIRRCTYVNQKKHIQPVLTEDNLLHVNPNEISLPIK